MSMTDVIADMLTRLRNGQKSKLMTVVCSYSKMKDDILKVLKEEGYIDGYQVLSSSTFAQIEIKLKYSINGKGAINEIHKVSKPGKRMYSSIDNLQGYYNYMGIYILSTSKGVISDRLARAYRVGGEVICKVF